MRSFNKLIYLDELHLENVSKKQKNDLPVHMNHWKSKETA